jgi:hypothetical protein
VPVGRPGWLTSFGPGPVVPMPEDVPPTGGVGDGDEVGRSDGVPGVERGAAGVPVVEPVLVPPPTPVRGVDGDVAGVLPGTLLGVEAPGPV